MTYSYIVKIQTFSQYKIFNHYMIVQIERQGSNDRKLRATERPHVTESRDSPVLRCYGSVSTSHRRLTFHFITIGPMKSMSTSMG